MCLVEFINNAILTSTNNAAFREELTEYCLKFASNIHFICSSKDVAYCIISSSFLRLYEIEKQSGRNFCQTEANYTLRNYIIFEHVRIILQQNDVIVYKSDVKYVSVP